MLTTLILFQKSNVITLPQLKMDSSKCQISVEATFTGAELRIIATQDTFSGETQPGTTRVGNGFIRNVSEKKFWQKTRQGQVSLDQIYCSKSCKLGCCLPWKYLQKHPSFNGSLNCSEKFHVSPFLTLVMVIISNLHVIFWTCDWSLQTIKSLIGQNRTSVSVVTSFSLMDFFTPCMFPN